jgi:hypothetical protein
VRRSVSWSCALLLLPTLGLGATACSTSDKTAKTTPVQSTSTVAATSVPKGYVPGKEVPEPALAAIRKHLTTNGPPLGTWVITSALVSTVDPTYVMFRISPGEGHEAEVEGGYGFAHNQGGNWTVTGFGTDAVGCPPGSAQNQPVPAKVLVAFSITCAPVS